VVFAIDDGVHGQQIWSTDGTALGTTMLAEVPSVSVSTGPDHDPVILGGGTSGGQFDPSRVFFSLEDGQDLWSTDGTVAGTALAAALVCFLPGTLIATPNGETPVQCLKPGDEVTTLGRTTRRIVWIGHGRVAAKRGHRNAATPVIIRRGAFANGIPYRDLHVTKGHSFLVDGVLIPIEYLVNHRSIIWDDHAQEVALYHIELDTHDILLANGAPAESYRDDGNRWLFENANNGWSAPPKQPCAPVLTGGPIVDAAWERLLKRAGPRPGLPLTSNPDLHLLADGRRVDAVSNRDNAFVFRLRTASPEIRIRSRAAIPAEIGVARDPRPLGVALHKVVLRRGSRFRVIDMTEPELVHGFHGFETTDRIRWTNGDATLPNSLLGTMAGAREIVLHVGGVTRYVDDGH
jgi:ELWxxDGT repeat protein